GMVYKEEGNKESALLNFNEALVISKEIGARLGEANALQGLGDVQMRRNAYDEAEQAYADALKIYKDVGDRLGEANACLGLGNLCEAKGDRSAALESFQKALQIGEEIGYNFACKAAKEGIERLG
ncbi:MAG: tetratricopeptide repeat protein, partial [Kiritimatiellae bacterium]|nr:tetratricopeptide repeat protein [Kiritimatiellia bacterium]